MIKSTETEFIGISATVEDFETLVQFLDVEGFDEMKDIVNRMLKFHSDYVRKELKEKEGFIKANPFCMDLVPGLPEEVA